MLFLKVVHTLCRSGSGCLQSAERRPADGNKRHFDHIRASCSFSGWQVYFLHHSNEFLRTSRKNFPLLIRILK
nr:MAG TPA: hypothetical protein [Caudoviricetes sp.]